MFSICFNEKLKRMNLVILILFLKTAKLGDPENFVSKFWYNLETWSRAWRLDSIWLGLIQICPAQRILKFWLLSSVRVVLARDRVICHAFQLFFKLCRWLMPSKTPYACLGTCGLQPHYWVSKILLV